MDAALLSNPAVAEAVSFGAPDEKYGEVVAAAVVLRPGELSGLVTKVFWLACVRLHGFRQLQTLLCRMRVASVDLL